MIKKLIINEDELKIMRIKHPENYQSYEDLNKLSLRSRIVMIIFIVLLLTGIIGGIAYYKIQQVQTVSREQITAMNHLANSVADLDTEPETIDYLKNSTDSIERIKIGTPVVLKHSFENYNKNMSGYNYPIVDYFRISNTNYYIRTIFTSDTQEKYQTMLLNKNNYLAYHQLDQLQADFAKSIKGQNSYNQDKLSQLIAFKAKHHDLHN